MAYSVFIVDDDVKLAALLKTYFEQDGFVAHEVHDGSQVLSLVKQLKPDILVLDVMLPGADGWEICRKLRNESDIPIIMLTARDEEADRLNGLAIGADDYVTKPFSPREVVARARVILRRTGKLSKPEPILKYGDLTLSSERHQVQKGSEILDLTPTEFKILELFFENPGRVFSRLQIVERVQGYAFEGYERTIDAHVKNLRRKIEESPKNPQYVQTVYGVGYRFATAEIQ